MDSGVTMGHSQFSHLTTKITVWWPVASGRRQTMPTDTALTWPGRGEAGA